MNTSLDKRKPYIYLMPSLGPLKFNTQPDMKNEPTVVEDVNCNILNEHL